MVPLQRAKKMLKETARCKWLLIVIELFDIAINDFGAEWKTMLVLAELVASNTQCTLLGIRGLQYVIVNKFRPQL